MCQRQEVFLAGFLLVSYVGCYENISVLDANLNIYDKTWVCPPLCIIPKVCHKHTKYFQKTRFYKEFLQHKIMIMFSLKNTTWTLLQLVAWFYWREPSCNQLRAANWTDSHICIRFEKLDKYGWHSKRWNCFWPAGITY